MNIYQPIVSRRQLKYIKSTNQTDKQWQLIINDAIKFYIKFIECIYENQSEKNV